VAVICSLRPNVTAAEAIALLNPRSVFGAVQHHLAGPLRSLAAVYAPFQVFRATIQNGSKREESLLGIETVRGLLDLYGFGRAPALSELVRVETRNYIPAELPLDHAAELLKERLRQIIFRRGFFFRVRTLSIKVAPIGGGVYIPYWLGFRGRGIRAHLSVVDAVRRRSEGARARDLFRLWLLVSQPLT
jgi:hypothetical protein